MLFIFYALPYLISQHDEKNVIAVPISQMKKIGVEKINILSWITDSIFC